MFELSLPPLLAFAVALAVTPAVRSFALRYGIVDEPGARKVHLVAMARIGGVAVVAGIVAGITCLQALGYWDAGMEGLDEACALALALGVPIIFVIGLADDIRHLPVSIKFLVQAVAAVAAMASGILIESVSLFNAHSIELGLFAYPLTFFWIVGITNAFNLIDGLDGLATGLVSIAAGTSAVIYFLKGDLATGSLMMVVVGASLGFLRYNFNPATIFLGDCGSLTLGYILAVTAVSGSQKQALALATVIPLLVLGLPIFDTLLSMLRRLLGGIEALSAYRAPLRSRLKACRRMFDADQGHIHHRLLALGLSHRNAVLVLYSCALGLSGLAMVSVLAQYRNAGLALLTTGLGAYIGIRKLGYREVDFLRSRVLLRWYDRFTVKRRVFIGVLDLALVVIAYWLAAELKYDAYWSQEALRWHVNWFPGIILIQVCALAIMGLHRGVWRALGVGDLIHGCLAAAVAALISCIVALIDGQRPPGAYSFFVINFLLLAALLVGSRSAYRVLHYLSRLERHEDEGALIYDAGPLGELTLGQILRDDSLKLRPVGFLDDHPEMHRRTVNRIPVFGPDDDLAPLFEGGRVRTVIVASPDLPEETMQRLMERLRPWKVRIACYRLQLQPVAMATASTPYEAHAQANA